MKKIALSILLVLSVVVLVGVLVDVHIRKPKAPTAELNVEGKTSGTPRGRWAVVGTGMSAATVVYYMHPPLRAATLLKEASSRFGGRVLTAPNSFAGINTTMQMQEFGAWVFDKFGHSRVKTLLQSLEVPSYSQIFYPGQSFLFFNGVKSPWPAVPTIKNDMTYSSVTNPNEWIAHTGILPELVPTASAKSVWNLTIPITASVVTGLGWQDVPSRAIMANLVQYNRQLSDVSVTTSGAVRLTYTSGNVEEVEGAVLTCPPQELSKITGITAECKQAISDSLVSVSVGVLYAQWSAQNTWWPAAGFDHAVAATDTKLGRIGTADAGVLRCKIPGEESISYWTNLIVTGGMPAAAAQVAVILGQVFGKTDIPPPSYVSFRGWPNGIYLWKFGVDHETARGKMIRPCGAHVPVWWASGDVSENQGWVEGCVEAGLATAAAVNTYVTRR
jgi:hypothetical protein